jgi:hypothetical protein
MGAAFVKATRQSPGKQAIALDKMNAGPVSAPELTTLETASG